MEKSENGKPLVVLDLDGVVFDVSGSYREAIRETVESFSGQPISLAEIARVKNESGLNNDWKVTEAILRQREYAIPYGEIVNQFQQAYLGNGFDGLIRKDKLLVRRTAMDWLATNCVLCVLTGRPRQEALFSLERFRLREFFRKVVCQEDCAPREKPDPFGLTQIKQNYPENEGYYAGDTVSDIQCAKRAGFVPIGVLPPQDQSDELASRLRAAGAWRIVSNINVLPEILAPKKRNINRNQSNTGVDR
ncbi:MAG: HAD-IA family hydrolase [Candidatus Diapherotrites archaeon]|nr:HAD-IA family hydrolase [Candidatus Diapherotrites archaeon]